MQSFGSHPFSYIMIIVVLQKILGLLFNSALTTFIIFLDVIIVFSTMIHFSLIYLKEKNNGIYEIFLKDGIIFCITTIIACIRIDCWKTSLLVTLIFFEYSYSIPKKKNIVYINYDPLTSVSVSYNQDIPKTNHSF